MRVLLFILERQGNGQNFSPPRVSPSGGGGGGGGGTFFLLALLFAGHGAGFIVLLLLLLAVGGFNLFSRRGAGVTDESYMPPPIPPASPRSDLPGNAAEASAYGASAGGGTTGAAAAGGPGAYDDTRPVGVPDRFRGAMLDGSDESAVLAPTSSVADGIAAVRAHDPAFDEEAFLSQAQTSFFTIQQAWMECKPELSRSVMADGLAQQTAMQLAEYQRDNRRNRLDGLTIGDARIVGAHSDASYDTITVRFAAASADYDVDATSGRVVRGHRDVQDWTEDWIFQRSARATTKADGLMTRKCPNCQAPLSINAEGVCEYCHAPVMSGKYDWVLARIDQVQTGW